MSITVGAAGARPIRVPLLRGSLTVASGAPHLAARTRAALLPTLTVRDGRGRFLTRIEAPLPVPGTGPGPFDAASLRETVVELARRLEPCALAHADQIVWGLTCFDPRPAPATLATEG